VLHAAFKAKNVDVVVTLSSGFSNFDKFE